MIGLKTEAVELFSRLGKVGSIQAFNPWDARKSVAHAKAWVAQVASLSYGNQEAANPEKLFQNIVDRGHLSCLEFVPVGAYAGRLGRSHALPYQSLRRYGVAALGDPDFSDYESEEKEDPASAFLVTCPLYTRSQWMRHRSFSYLEMSRRYTKGSKVAWEFYGSEDPEMHQEQQDAVRKYERRLELGMPSELARGIIPQEAMTKIWIAGFDRDWREFIRLRSDAHAQPEIRVYSDWIRDYLDSKETK